MSVETFNMFLIIMSAIAVIVFIALHFVNAGYGKFASEKWGIALDNKIGWILMESPAFITMFILWILSDRAFSPVPLVIFICFEIHYFQRSFIFPFLLKGKSKMPVLIILMGAAFNIINAFIQGGWLFYLAPADRYTVSWFCTPQFIAGILIFFTGMAINLHSDSVIRNLRKPGDTKHYLPEKGLYKYVTSANYFGEIVEWGGFALMTMSWSGLLFFFWTIANLLPRSEKIYDRYREEFGDRMKGKNLKRIFPFIY